MSVSDELTRIQRAKASLKTSITNKGVEVPDTALIDAYPAKFEREYVETDEKIPEPEEETEA